VQPLWPPSVTSGGASLIFRGLLVQLRDQHLQTGLPALNIVSASGGEPMSDDQADQVGIEQASKYQDRSINCVDCGEAFIWTVGEQVFFHDKGLKNEPKRCKPCKQAKNDRLAAISLAQSSAVKQRVEVTVMCAQCHEETTVPFYPSQGRPVYCRACFIAARAMTASA
jgi:CxxC-x17-CxxC domain-containing protein